MARECLIVGSVTGNSLTEFFKTRAKFISKDNEDHSEQDYFDKVVPEFLKMQHIPNNVDINLWFEDDLFCQVNFWFVVNLLSKSQQDNRFFLIRPRVHNQYGFGGLNKSELISLYENRLELTELDKLSKLWESYQVSDTEKLINTSQQLINTYPFISTAVHAHIERIPTNGNMGRPSESLIRIMNDLNTIEFGPIFREFCKREAIYGFGDLQVKKLLDEIKNNR